MPSLWVFRVDNSLDFFFINNSFLTVALMSITSLRSQSYINIFFHQYIYFFSVLIYTASVLFWNSLQGGSHDKNALSLIAMLALHATSFLPVSFAHPVNLFLLTGIIISTSTCLQVLLHFFLFFLNIYSLYAYARQLFVSLTPSAVSNLFAVMNNFQHYTSLSFLYPNK